MLLVVEEELPLAAVDAMFDTEILQICRGIKLGTFEEELS